VPPGLRSRDSPLRHAPDLVYLGGHPAGPLRHLGRPALLLRSRRLHPADGGADRGLHLRRIPPSPARILRSRRTRPRWWWDLPSGSPFPPRLHPPLPCLEEAFSSGTCVSTPSGEPLIGGCQSSGAPRARFPRIALPSLLWRFRNIYLLPVFSIQARLRRPCRILPEILELNTERLTSSKSPEACPPAAPWTLFGALLGLGASFRGISPRLSW